MHRCLVSLAAIILAGAAGAARPALADEPPAKPGKAAIQPEDGAAELLRKGNRAFKEGRFADAEGAYREAWRIKQGYDIAGNLGSAELALGKMRDAAEHLAFSLHSYPITGDPGVRDRMAKALDKCREEVGSVRVLVEPKGAVVWVDGARVGEAPLADEVFVEPGEHVFEAKLDGYRGEPQRLRMEKGGAAEITIDLSPVPKPAGDTLDPLAPKRRSLAPAIGLGAVALVGLGAGAALTGVSASKRADAASIRALIAGGQGSCVKGAANYDPRCPDLQSRLHADDVMHDVAVGAFVVGAAAAVGTATYLLWPTSRSATTGRTLRVMPLFGESSGAVMVSGSF